MAMEFRGTVAVAVLLVLYVLPWADAGRSTSFETEVVRRQLLSAIPDGGTCIYDLKGNPSPPFCKGGAYSCVVSHLPSPAVQVYLGTCDSNYQKGSFCQFRSIPYAIGTTGITANPLCNKCTCNLHPKLLGTNKAVCDCDPLPACYIDYDGKPYGSFRCPPRQSMCVITKPGGGGVDKRRLPVDKGTCVFSGITGICASGGATWGPKFYLQGVSGVPSSGNRCIRCTCSASRLTSCQKVAGCTKP